MAYSTEDIMKIFGGAGWDGLDTKESEAQQIERAEEEYAINSAIAKTFSTSTGKTTFNWLEKRTMQQVAWDPEKDEKFGWTREGQNSVFKEIKRRIDLAAEGPPTAKKKGGKK